MKQFKYNKDKSAKDNWDNFMSEFESVLPNTQIEYIEATCHNIKTRSEIELLLHEKCEAVEYWNSDDNINWDNLEKTTDYDN